MWLFSYGFLVLFVCLFVFDGVLLARRLLSSQRERGKLFRGVMTILYLTEGKNHVHRQTHL